MMMAIQHNALGGITAALAFDHQASSDFDLNPDITLPTGRVLRDAGVLMAIRPEWRWLKVPRVAS